MADFERGGGDWQVRISRGSTNAAQEGDQAEADKLGGISNSAKRENGVGTGNWNCRPVKQNLRGKSPVSVL